MIYYANKFGPSNKKWMSYAVTHRTIMKKMKNCHLRGQVYLFVFVFLPLFLGIILRFSLSVRGSTGEGGGGSCCA